VSFYPVVPALAYYDLAMYQNLNTMLALDEALFPALKIYDPATAG
jgi:hypothetical protein